MFGLFEELTRYTGSKEINEGVALGFQSRQDARDKLYSKRAKSQEPTNKFLNRMYTSGE